jgi:hypothetical protein
MDHENWLELADVYAAEALDGEDLSEFNAHLAAGCPLCQARIRETHEALAGISFPWNPSLPRLRSKKKS